MWINDETNFITSTLIFQDGSNKPNYVMIRQHHGTVNLL
jgi:hypothetical protein